MGLNTGVFRALFGDTLVTRHGANIPTHEALQHKRVVGIFFMASVCERSRLFTPALATVRRNMQLQMYHELAMQHAFEVVVVSMDANPIAFRDFLAQTPFLAMPLHERRRAHALLQRYDVRRMPSVVFIDDAAQVIERNGRALIEDNYKDLRAIWTTLATTRANPLPAT